MVNFMYVKLCVSIHIKIITAYFVNEANQRVVTIKDVKNLIRRKNRMVRAEYIVRIFLQLNNKI